MRRIAVVIVVVVLLAAAAATSAYAAKPPAAAPPSAPPSDFFGMVSEDAFQVEGAYRQPPGRVSLISTDRMRSPALHVRWNWQMAAGPGRARPRDPAGGS